MPGSRPMEYDTVSMVPGSTRPRVFLTQGFSYT